MSLSAKLQLGDNTLQLYNKEYNVVECKYAMNKSYNVRTHRIDTTTERAEIELSVIAPSGGDFLLYSWYSDKMMLSGRIVIDISSISVSYSDKSQKSICFNDAYCISISESYDIHSKFRRELTLRILVKRLDVDMIEYYI